MTPLKISVGYNGAPNFAEVIAKYRDWVADVYFVAPFMPSGRGAPGDAAEQVYGLRLHEFLKFAMREGIRANFLFNSLCLGEGYGSTVIGQGLAETIAFFTHTYQLASATVVSRIDGELIKKRFPNVNVHASVNMFIRNPHQALEVKEIADTIILDRNVNRDLELIREIKEVFGLTRAKSESLRVLMRGKHIVFVGYALGDPDITPILREDIATGYYCISPSEADGLRYARLFTGRYRGRFRLTGEEAGTMLVELAGAEATPPTPIDDEIRGAFRDWAKCTSLSEKYQIAGHVLNYVGRTEDAILCFKRSLRYNRDAEKKARIWETLAITYGSEQNWRMSRRYFQQIRQKGDESVSAHARLDALSGIVNGHVFEGNEKESRLGLQLLMGESESLSPSPDSLFSVFLTIETALMYLHSFAVEPEEEQFLLTCAEDALGLAERMKATESYAKLLSMLAHYYETKTPERTRAFGLYRKVLRIYQEMGDELSFAQVLNSMSGVLFERNRYNDAIRFASVAESIFGRYEAGEDQAMCWRNISLAYGALGREEKQLQAREKSESILTESLRAETEAFVEGIAAELRKHGGEVTIEKA